MQKILFIQNKVSSEASSGWTWLIVVGLKKQTPRYFNGFYLKRFLLHQTTSTTSYMHSCLLGDMIPSNLVYRSLMIDGNVTSVWCSIVFCRSLYWSYCTLANYGSSMLVTRTTAHSACKTAKETENYWFCSCRQWSKVSICARNHTLQCFWLTKAGLYAPVVVQ